jgi:hypothetical protein
MLGGVKVPPGEWRRCGIAARGETCRNGNYGTGNRAGARQAGRGQAGPPGTPRAAVCWHAARTGLWRSGELNMRGERRSGHAGPLAAWERLAIAAILGIMVAVAIGLAVS